MRNKCPTSFLYILSLRSLFTQSTPHKLRIFDTNNCFLIIEKAFKQSNKIVKLLMTSQKRAETRHLNCCFHGSDGKRQIHCGAARSNIRRVGRLRCDCIRFRDIELGR